MGWWKIADSGGGIDWSSAMTNRFAENDTKTELYNGDGPADIICDALVRIQVIKDNSELIDKLIADINNEYMSEWNRKPSPEEWEAVVNFVCIGNDKRTERRLRKLLKDRGVLPT